MRLLTTILTILAVKNVALSLAFYLHGEAGIAAWAAAQATALLLLAALAPRPRG